AWSILRAYSTDRVRHYWVALVILIIGAFTHPSFVFAAIGMAIGISAVTASGDFGLRWPSRNAWKHLWLPLCIVLFAAILGLFFTGSESALQNHEARGPAATLYLLPAVVQRISPAHCVIGAVAIAVLLVARLEPEYRRWAAVAAGGTGSTLAGIVVASTRTDV